MKHLLKVLWPDKPTTYTPSREQLERAADEAFRGADYPSPHVVAWCLRESGYKIKPEDAARARELDAASKAAQDLLVRHGKDTERLAELEHAEQAAAAALEGKTISQRDVPAEFTSARTAARDAAERAGEGAAELYCRVVAECLPAVERFVDSHVTAERSLHETLGLKYRPSGVSLALHGVPARLAEFSAKLRDNPRRSLSVRTLFEAFEVFAAMPPAPPPPPKPAPYVPPAGTRDVELTPQQVAEMRRVALAAKEANKAQLAAAGIITLGGGR